MNKYKVIDWDTRIILKEFDEISKAKKYCRSLGYIEYDNPLFTNYPPIAYVSDEDFCLVYNPRFKKEK